MKKSTDKPAKINKWKQTLLYLTNSRMKQNSIKTAILQEYFIVEKVAVQWRRTTLYLNISFHDTKKVKNCEFYGNFNNSLLCKNHMALFPQQPYIIGPKSIFFFKTCI